MKLKNIFRSCAAMFLVAFSPALARAQVQNGSSGAPGGQRTLTLQESLEASFNIEPVVHRLNGRRGEVLPFSFLITSTGKSMNVSVYVVNLRQEESGNVFHDPNSNPSQFVRFTSETNFPLGPGESRTIAGEVTVPLSKTNFLSYGILVKDSGVNTGNVGEAAANAATRASIRFVTQYVLRLDIETGGIDLKELEQVDLQNGSIRAVQGFPVAEMFINNPTDMAVECSVDLTIRNEKGKKLKTIALGMPCRSDMPDSDRYLVRLMPNSRVRVMAPVDIVLLPGKHLLQYSLKIGRREVRNAQFDYQVRTGQFPALDAKLSILDELITVEPAQLELGRIAGTHRMGVLRFTNCGEADQAISLSSCDLQGNLFSGVKFSTEDFVLSPGKSKSVRAVIQSVEGVEQAIYGSVVVKQGADKHSNVPLVLLFGEPAKISVVLADFAAISAMNSEASNERSLLPQVFRASLENLGLGFAPVHGELEITSPDGRTWSMTDGFGRWMNPQEKRDLVFTTPLHLPDGAYRLSLVIRTTPESPLISRTFDVTLPLAVGSGESIQAGQPVLVSKDVEAT